MFLKIVGVGSGPKEITEKAVSHYKANRKELRKAKSSFSDQVWAVFDKDEHPEFEASIARCNDAGVQTAFSNPCFKLWLILHHSDMDQPLTRHQAQSQCEQWNLFAKGSEKKPNCEWLLETERVLQAEKRAAVQLRKRSAEGLPCGPPATTVGKLTKTLRKMGNADS